MRGKRKKKGMPNQGNAASLKTQGGHGQVFQKDMELEFLIEDMGVEGQGIGKAGGIIFL